jgi:hypothetical protein
MAEEKATSTPIKKKKGSSLPLLLGVLAVLAVVTVLVADPAGWFKPSADEELKQDPARRTLVAAKAEAISAFEITPAGGSEGFKLVRDGEQWFVEQDGKRFKAAQDKVDQLLEELPELRADGLATDKATLYDDMEVSDAKAIRLAVYAGGTEPDVTLLVGKAAPGYTTSFVRLDGTPEVYRAATNVKTLVGYSFPDYRSRKPWAFDPETATALTVQQFTPAPEKELKADPPAADAPRHSFTLTDGLWQKDGANGNQNSIKELVKAFSELETNEFIDAPSNAETKLDGRQPALSVTTPAGAYTLTLGAKDGSFWFVQDQDGHVYKVTDYGLAFYRELDFDKLTFDDTPKEEPKAEGEESAEEEGEGVTKGTANKLPPEDK